MNEKRFGFVVVVVVITALAVGAVGFATKRANERLIEADLIQCESANKVRAWVRWDVRLNAGAPLLRTQTADRLFPILDCEATQATGRNVQLSAEEQEAFIVSQIGPLDDPQT